MSIKAESNKIVFQSKDELMVIEPYGENIIRVRSTKNRTLSEKSHTLLAPGEHKAVCTSDGVGKAFIQNSMLSVEAESIDGKCVLTFFRNGKKILKSKEDGVRRFRGMIQDKYLHKGGNNYRIKIRFEADDNEHFYGLGQESGAPFDKKNSTSELLHANTKSTVPVVYSSLGYGFFWNNPAIGRCELGKTQTAWIADSSYQADYLVFTGETPADIMHSYCNLTGFAPMMPEWVSGFWQSKLRYESQEDLLSVTKAYKEKNLPLDAIVIDYFHWSEQGDWDFDFNYWENPVKMCSELREMNIEPVVSVWPTINPKSRNFDYMSDEGMIVSSENGQDVLFDFYGQQRYIDPTNPKTREFQWQQIQKSYFTYGIKSYWLDATEPEIYPQQFDNLRYFLGNGEEVSLIYPYYNQKTFYDGLKENNEKYCVLLTRCAYAGSQKFGSVVWNGDIPSTFEALKESIVSGLSMAMSGIAWWNSDIGGFSGGDTETDYFRELIVRWFQFGLFCPVMRLHGVRKRQSYYESRHPGIDEESGGDNEIWSFGEETYEILKDILILRQKLKPYTMKLADEVHKNGTPIMRPMFFEFPDDPKCYTTDDQYMYGPDILFAPIHKYGETSRQVYLPEGEWIRTSDMSEHNGEKYLECRAEKNEFIAFVRKGADVLDVFKIRDV